MNSDTKKIENPEKNEQDGVVEDLNNKNINDNKTPQSDKDGNDIDENMGKYPIEVRNFEKVTNHLQKKAPFEMGKAVMITKDERV